MASASDTDSPIELVIAYIWWTGESLMYCVSDEFDRRMSFALIDEPLLVLFHDAPVLVVDFRIESRMDVVVVKRQTDFETE